MKLSLPTLVDHQNDVPGVVNALAQAPSGDGSVIADVPAITNNAQHDANAPPSINKATTTNNAPNDASKDAPNDVSNNVTKNALKNASASPHNVAAGLESNNVSISGNVAAPAVNNVPAVPAPPNADLAPPNAAFVNAVPPVDVVVPPAPSYAPTVKDAPTNVVVKMEQMENEEVVIVPKNKNFKECVMFVLDHTNDEQEDDPKITCSYHPQDKS